MTDQGRLLLALMQLPGIGRKTINRYMLPLSANCSDFTGIRDILEDAHKKTARVKEFSNDEIESAIVKADHILDDCEQLDIKTTAITDPDFPSRLHSVDDPPIVLYYRGNLDSLENHTIAIIGTREPTDYGYRIAVRIGEMMAVNGITTVSGLATGCDTGGHTGTVNKNGSSVALLANGLDTIYPKENQKLAAQMLELGGCLISEYPPKAEMQRGFFVDRDRLQAALSDGIFVVETDIKGGTMHTVHFGQQYGKKIYCFNHPEKYLGEDKTRGNQKLIKDEVAISVGSKNDIDNMLQTLKSTFGSSGGALEQPSQISMWGNGG